MTSDGSPYTRLRRAIQSGNLPLINATAAEMGWVPLREALAILLVIDAKEEARFDAAAVRWAGRLALEVRDLELAEFAGAVESLHALPDENAQRSLLALTQRAMRPPGVPRSLAASRRSQQGLRRGLGS
ncbi:hypothetical protein OJ998_04700 [Solirubrobacter taibaiensis]|nr:hypothetical protein [Solirubrobacter taibaiensis]